MKATARCFAHDSRKSRHFDEHNLHTSELASPEIRISTGWLSVEVVYYNSTASMGSSFLQATTDSQKAAFPKVLCVYRAPAFSMSDTRNLFYQSFAIRMYHKSAVGGTHWHCRVARAVVCQIFRHNLVVCVKLKLHIATSSKPAKSRHKLSTLRALLCTCYRLWPYRFMHLRTEQTVVEELRPNSAFEQVFASGLHLPTANSRPEQRKVGSQQYKASARATCRDESTNTCLPRRRAVAAAGC